MLFAWWLLGAALMLSPLLLWSRPRGLRAAAQDQLAAWSQDGCVTVDRTDRILDANPAARRLLDLPSPPTGLPVTRALPAWSQWVASARAGGERTFDLRRGARTVQVTLAPLPSGWVALARDVTAERAVAASLDVQWHEDLLRQGQRPLFNDRDPLTGLPGRRALDAALAPDSALDARATTLVLLDLDRPVQGEALRRFARLLSEHVRASDLVVRLEDGAFVVLLSGMGLEAVHRRVELWRSLARDLPAGGAVGFTAGIVGCPPAEDVTSDTLLRLADQALHEARRPPRSLHPKAGGSQP